MATKQPKLTIRPMTTDDIEQVIALDRLGFPTPWSRSTYAYEIQRNRRSTMMVLENDSAPPTHKDDRPWLARLLQRTPMVTNTPGALVGYAGFWQIEDEAHISTITVHPDWRGLKLGELLLTTMIDLSLIQGADKVTLEVRVSNDVAKGLYRKYGFRKIGRRRGYYRDNGEDAHIMMVETLDDEYLTRLDRLRDAIAEHVHYTDKMPRTEGEKSA